jgi:uncharacterized membrane protein
MAGKNTPAFGIYNDQEGVERGVDAANGYRNTDISVLFPENSGTKDFAHEKHTKAPEGATTGAGSGVVLGGTLGWLAGIGALAIPGLGPFIAAGPIMACTCRRRSRRNCRRFGGSFSRDGYTRIRSQTVRGPDQERRYSSFSTL